MYEAADFLRNIALVLCVAAVTTVVFQRLRQPVVFGYLIAGMIIGPHIPIPLVADETTVHTLAELGVILLMFGLGLEFSLRKLLQVGPTAGLVAVAETSMMVWFGFLVGHLFGWSALESVFAGAVIAISSTTIIVKAFAEQGVTGKVSEIVFGVLIIEDLIGIFLIAVLTTVAAGAGVSPGSIAITAARLITFLVGLVGVGLLVIPRLVRYVVRLNRPETTLVASVGICFAAALLALAFGYSVALGAFIAGSLVSESGEEKAIEPLIAPVRDIFVAIFFVAVGMLIDPALIVQHWVAVVAFTLVVLVGKVVAVSLGAFLTGFPFRTSVQTAMSMAQIGEFSFIIAGVGLATDATHDYLYTVAIAVSAITTLTTPWLIRASGPVASYVDGRLPPALQTFVSLYGSWVERLRSAPRESTGVSRTRHLIRFLLLDATLLTGVVIGASLQLERAAGILMRLVGLSGGIARLVVIAGAAVVAVPLVVGLLRSARQLGLTLALRALPATEEGAEVEEDEDLAAVPRGVLVVALQLAIVSLIGAPIVAVTQPFLPPLRGAAVFAIVLVILVVGLLRGANTLQDHAHAGAELIVATLARQMATEAEVLESGTDHDGQSGYKEREDSEREDEQLLTKVRRALLGLGDPVSVRLSSGSSAVQKTLTELNLRGLTGATVLAITREGEPVVIPTGREVLRAGDVLAVAGTQDATSAAVQLLRMGA